MTTERTHTADDLAAAYAAEVAAVDAAHRPPPAELSPNMGLRTNWDGIGPWLRDRQAAEVRHRERLAAAGYAPPDSPLAAAEIAREYATAVAEIDAAWRRDRQAAYVKLGERLAAVTSASKGETQ